MPTKRTFRKRRGKTRRRKRRSRRRAVIPWAFPKTKVCRMRYVEQIELNAGGAGVIAYHDFCANGVYDPSITSVGHQPYGFDQIMVGYDHFTVIGSKITVRNINSNTAHNLPAYLTVGLFDTTASALTFNNIEHMLESNRINKNGPVAGGGAYLGNYKRGYNTVTKTFSSKKFFNKQINEEELQGTAASNPTERAVFSVMASSIQGNDPAPLDILVTIDYIVLLTEPKILAQS